MAKQIALTPAEQFELHQMMFIDQDDKEEVTLALSRVWDIFMTLRAKLDEGEAAAFNEVDLSMLRDMRRVFQPLVTFH